MSDSRKTKKQLLEELEALRRELAAFQAAPAAHAGMSEGHGGQEFDKSLILHSAVPTFVLDPQHRVICWNNACEELTGIKASDVIGTDSHWKAFYDRKRPCLADIIIQGGTDDLGSYYASYGRSALVANGLRAEGWYPDIGGRKRYITFEAAPIFNDDGTLAAVIETLQDITRRKRAEEALQKSERKLRDITSSLGEGIYMLDEQRQLIFMNPEAERLLGWTEKELAGRNMHDIIHYRKKDGSLLPAEDCPVHKVINTGVKYYTEEDVFVRKDGSLLPVAYVSTPVIEDGRIAASITVFHDITERKRMTAEIINAKKIESVGILASGIAHDFNNLLTGILSSIYLSKQLVKPGDEIYENLSVAEQASKQAKDLVHQLYTFAKIGTTVKRAVSISKLIKDSIAFSLSDSNIKCQLSVPDKLWPVEVDEGQMGRVFFNLLVNAKESMPDGGDIRISAENITISHEHAFPLKPGDYIRISVADQGAGIRKEYIQKVFDPYFTTKKKNNQKGTGLGLAICYSIVKNHEGYITIESALGAGTAAHVYLPASPKAQPGQE